MKRVTFHTIDRINFRLRHVSKIRSWLEECAKQEGKEIVSLVYVFCNDEYLLSLNQKFLNHDTYTDIITFDYSQQDKIIGEAYLSIERIKENAVIYKVSFQNELLRVLVHGLLHLCGYKDKTNSQCRLIRNKENEKILLFSRFT
ncbi:MAG: rRNA maturation RNase YbeY [Bacteroidia bacterium]|nr:rRNA maturation RNase YbeY [Bacteroidia bacterium]MDW8346741.1 rRNA maturation RNase YbeY [Bacteroidia bacterium]